jgi:hypothetical protein
MCRSCENRPLHLTCACLLTVLFCARAAAVSFVQGAAATPAGMQSSVSTTFPSAQSAGDLSVVFISWSDASSRVVSVTDSSGNLYLLATAASYATVATQVVYYASNIVHAAAGRNTVNVSFNVAVARADVRIVEYHGIDSRQPLDGAVGEAGYSEIATSGSATTWNKNDLLVAGTVTSHGVMGPGPAYTQRLMDDNAEILGDSSTATSGTYSASARQKATGWFVMQLVAFRVTPDDARSRPPYPQSQIVTGMEWNFSTVPSHRKAVGSDIWPTTWAADGNLYGAWGDGAGFDGTEQRKTTGRASLGFARISGTPEVEDPGSLVGKNVWAQAPRFAESQATFGGKVVDLISIEGVLYAQGGLWTKANCKCADPTIRSDDNPSERSLAWSTDLGHTWQMAPWSIADDLGTSLQFGQDYSGAFDPAHVYLYHQGNAKTDPTRIYLRRVLKGEITANPATVGHFEYFAGADAARNPRWSKDEADSVPVFVDPNIRSGVFAGPSSVIYDAPLRRYLFTAMHGNSTGQIGFFEGPSPWGPWRTLGYYADWGGFNETAGEATGFSMPSKWISSDGKTVWVVFSGVNNGAANEFDSFNLAKLTLRLDRSGVH